MFVIAQNLNASDPDVHAALAAGDRGWIEKAARDLASRGIDALDVNAGTLGSSEADVLVWMVEVIEAVVDVPLSLDSAHAAVLARACQRRRRPPILNSIPVDLLECPDTPTRALLDALADERGMRAIIQLRRGGVLPRSVSDRVDLLEAALAACERHGLDIERLWFDAVALPVVFDPESADVLLASLEPMRRAHPRARSLVGLGNLGHGADKAVQLEEEWLNRLAVAGLDGVILDARRPALLQRAR